MTVRRGLRARRSRASEERLGSARLHSTGLNSVLLVVREGCSNAGSLSEPPLRRGSQPVWFLSRIGGHEPEVGKAQPVAPRAPLVGTDLAAHQLPDSTEGLEPASTIANERNLHAGRCFHAPTAQLTFVEKMGN